MAKEYIEREALEVALNHRLNFLMAENGEYDHYTSGFDEAVTRVENFPAADVAPVVHGRWESYESLRYVGADGKGNPKYRNIRIYYCSQCGHCSIIRTKGCPNCRAKMDKEVADETERTN